MVIQAKALKGLLIVKIFLIMNKMCILTMLIFVIILILNYGCRTEDGSVLG